MREVRELIASATLGERLAFSLALWWLSVVALVSPATALESMIAASLEAQRLAHLDAVMGRG